MVEPKAALTMAVPVTPNGETTLQLKEQSLRRITETFAAELLPQTAPPAAQRHRAPRHEEGVPLQTSSTAPRHHWDQVEGFTHVFFGSLHTSEH